MKNIFERVLISLSMFVPKKSRDRMKVIIRHAGKTHAADIMIGLTILLGIIVIIGSLVFIRFYEYTETYVPISDIPGFDPAFGQIVDGEVVSGVVDGLTVSQQKIITFCIGFVLSGLPYMALFAFYYFITRRRASFVENILPDVLSLISSNIKSGLTPYLSVKSAIREEFGPLAKSFEIATNKSIGNKAFYESIQEVSDDYDSDSLRRCMKLFSAAIESGSNLASLLTNLARDIRERQALKNELVTSTKTNSMFILFMVIVGAPTLMAISIFFVDIVSGIMDQSSVGGGADMGISMGGEIAITSTFLTFYSYVLLFFTGLIVSYFAGVIVEGDGKNGLKKAPLIIGASYLVFIFVGFFIRTFMGGMF